MRAPPIDFSMPFKQRIRCGFEASLLHCQSILRLLSLITPEGLSPELEGRLRANQVSAAVAIERPLMLVNAINAVALCATLLIRGQASIPLLVWASLVVLVSGWKLVAASGSGRAVPPESVSPRTLRRVIRSAGVFGLLWAAPGIYLVPTVDGFSLAFLLVVLTGMIAGGGIALYPIPLAALAFMVPVTLCAATGLVFGYGTLAIGPIVVALMFLIVFVASVRRHSELFVSEFFAHIEIDQRARLIEDLLHHTRLTYVGDEDRRLERLIRAKKLEALGVLTGGIAHDFNNMLTAIRGNAELLAAGVPDQDAFIEAILEASGKGTRQVKRLLSIAQKQYLKPEWVDLKALIDGLQPVLQGRLGAGIQVASEIAPDLGRPFLDRLELETSLMNLIQNARDAMPSGGRLLIRCRHIGWPISDGRAQDAVAISISDTGVGMSTNTRERATEPFFTTKAFGSGSGLGLAAVEGFVRQSGGDLQIVSVAGVGTTVTLVFPVTCGEASRGEESAGLMQSRTRRVLLVASPEGNDREWTAKCLVELGFAVVELDTAANALNELARGLKVDALVTDLLWPSGMSGVELVTGARVHQPNLPALFLGGAKQGTSVMDPALLLRPFGRQELGEKLEWMLGPTYPLTEFLVNSANLTAPGTAA